MDGIKAVNPAQSGYSAGCKVNILAPYETYRVKTGDTLYKLAQRFGVKTEMIKLFSDLTADEITEGQELKIPTLDGVAENHTIAPASGKIGKSAHIHTVKEGDTPWKIAIENGIPLRELLASNGYQADDSIPAGVNLKVAVPVVPHQAATVPQEAELLEWYTAAQYVLPIDRTAKIHDPQTGEVFSVRRTGGTVHADCEPLTERENQIAQQIFGGYTSEVRPVLVETDGRYLAAAMNYFPHGASYLGDNGFDGHFNLYFLGSADHSNENDSHVHDAEVRAALTE